MNIVFFAHPLFLGHQSMPRYANMLAQGMTKRGHNVEIWYPTAYFFRLPLPAAFKKWMGYIDQYIIFPGIVWYRLRKTAGNTLFVLTDNALGPWMPLVAKRPHIMHCHDFLAQFSALDKIVENSTSRSGKLYQRYIRRGYSKAANFISVSQKTRDDLHQLLPSLPKRSEVVYNGLNRSFAPHDQFEARRTLGNKLGIDIMKGYLLHIGGNLWYKNREGVIEIYDAWRAQVNKALPLLMIGEQADGKLASRFDTSAFKTDIHLLSGIGDDLVRLAYAGATVFLFPSLAEGFGWPIAEAMASGCPVVTTNEPPMSEVAGDAAFLVSRYKANTSIKAWAGEAADVLQKIISLSGEEKQLVIAKCLENAKRFDADKALDKIAEIYDKVAGQNDQN